MLEITLAGWIVIGLGIFAGFLMIDTNGSNKAKQIICDQIDKIIPDPKTAKSRELVVIFIPAIALIAVVMTYIINSSSQN